jgi:hypothetical protein
MGVPVLPEARPRKPRAMVCSPSSKPGRIWMRSARRRPLCSGRSAALASLSTLHINRKNLRKAWDVPTNVQLLRALSLLPIGFCTADPSPASGLLRRPAPTARNVPLAGEAPWPLCARCVSAVTPGILCRQHPWWLIFFLRISGLLLQSRCVGRSGEACILRGRIRSSHA